MEVPVEVCLRGPLGQSPCNQHSETTGVHTVLLPVCEDSRLQVPIPHSHHLSSRGCSEWLPTAIHVLSGGGYGGGIFYFLSPFVSYVATPTYTYSLTGTFSLRWDRDYYLKGFGVCQSPMPQSLLMLASLLTAIAG